MRTLQALVDTIILASKTYCPADLAAPPVARVAGALRRFALRLGLTSVPLAVNGVLRQRFHVRRHKLWEYARGVACLQAAVDASHPRAPRVLDFGGGATLPVFYLAQCGWDVLSLDIDASLAEATNHVAAARPGWRLRGSTHDLTKLPAPEQWGLFEAVISFSVLEHLPRADRALALTRLAGLVRPGGVFVLTFDFGPEAPMANAVRSREEVEELVAATRLAYLGGGPFTDTGERFALDKRYPGRRFTFGSLFLRRPKSPERSLDG